MIVVRLTLLFLLTLAAYGVARRRSAALRHAILAAGMMASMVLPWLPAMPRRMAVTVPERVATMMATPSVGAPASGARAAGSGRGYTRREAMFAIWALGAALGLLRIALSLATARRLLRRGGITAPATIGVLRPVIVIPPHFSDDERAAAMAHESAHVRRRDPLTQLAARAAGALWWFHPLAWVIVRRLVLEQEKACDDAVLAGGVEPASYAELLLRTAARQSFGAATPMSGVRELETRLRAIVGGAERKTITRRAAGVVAVAALSAVTALAAVSVASSLFDDPASERLVPEVREIATMTPAPGADAQLYQSLLQLAGHASTWRGDLVGERARWALSRGRNGALLAPLREALDDSDWRVRAYAAWALAEAGDRVAVPRLSALLDDPVWRMRAMAATAIRAGGDPRAREAMLRAAADPAWQVRYEVAGYLGALGDPYAKRMAADPHIAVRSAAEEALVR